MASLKYWVWLASLRGVGAYTIKRLLDWFGSPEHVFFADDAVYNQIPELTKKDRAALDEKNLAEAGRILQDCEQYGYRVMTMFDGDYPTRLANIPDPPIVVYVRGRLPVVDEEAAVAVVGTRKCTPYGIKAAERIGYELARYGCLVVSGLARGIDSVAAKGALRAGGRVIGVVGSGLDIVYPRENKQLFDDVTASGAIVSEYPPGTGVSGAHFPQRNRIISGLSVGVTVIEAPLKSGALITASRALDQGRDVFAVPGNVDSPVCAGSNQLLREGAVLVTSGREIAEEYVALYPDKIVGDRPKVPLDPSMEDRLIAETVAGKRQNQPKKEIDNTKTVEYIDLVSLKEQLGDEEFAVLSAIGPKTRHVDELIEQTKMEAGAVLTALTLLEIDGYVEQLPGKHFRLVYELKT